MSAVSHALRNTLWAVLFWTGLGLFFSSQLVLAGLQWKEALAFTMPRWYTWGLLTPLILRTDRKLGGGLTLRQRVAIHIPIGIAFTLLCVTVRLLTRPLRGSAPPQSIEQFFLERFYWDLLIYAVIAGVAISREYARQTRDREREASDLAVQAADLERRLAESRLQVLRAQLHPHFLFNALNTISAFTETNPRAARRLMEQLGDLLRASLTHASQPFVTLGEELTILDDYLALVSARFEGRITVSVCAEDDLLDCMVPSFLLQPLVENAIRHGVAPRLTPGLVDVTATRGSGLLRLRVRDNGAGLPPGWQFPRDAGIGLRNVASRLKHLYGDAGCLAIETAAAGGVDVRIEFPVQTAAVPEVAANA